MKDVYGEEFTSESIHCFNCKHYRDCEDANFSLCARQNSCLPMVQLKKIGRVFCHYFENKNDAGISDECVKKDKDGFLPEERSGQYPDISYDAGIGIYEARLHATLINPPMAAVFIRVQASSMDKLRDAWNKRGA